jgi:uncharacterized membrane protein YhhN
MCGLSKWEYPDCGDKSMWIWVPVPLMYGSLALLLRADNRVPQDLQQVKIWKPLATVLVILTCVLSFTRQTDSFDTPYTLLILGGLIFSLLGDWLLIFQDNAKAFLGGLVAFLLAHVTYIVAFVDLQVSKLETRNNVGEMALGIILAIVGGAVYSYLRPGLGSMRRPVIAYIIVISLMVHRAFAIALVHPGPAIQPALITLGALLFYLSDAILAVNRFRLDGQMPNYRLYNLSTYYTGQMLLALSASFFA